MVGSVGPPWVQEMSWWAWVIAGGLSRSMVVRPWSRMVIAMRWALVAEMWPPVSRVHTPAASGLGFGVREVGEGGGLFLGAHGPGGRLGELVESRAESCGELGDRVGAVE